MTAAKDYLEDCEGHLTHTLIAAVTSLGLWAPCRVPASRGAGLHLTLCIQAGNARVELTAAAGDLVRLAAARGAGAAIGPSLPKDVQCPSTPAKDLLS